MKSVLSLLLLCLFATSGYSQTDQKNPYRKLAPTPNSKTKKHDFGKAATAEIYKQASNSDLWIYRFDPPNFDPEKDKRPAAESLLRPAGRASFGGRSFDVVSDGAFIDPDRQVKVLAIHGNRIAVTEIEDDDLGDTVHHSKNA